MVIIKSKLFTLIILSLIFGLLQFPITTISAEGGVGLASEPPQVDAGPDKSIAFPSKDLTLFGHAINQGDLTPTFLWTQISGPATASFSAPWSLTTTVSFTTPGTYTFQLSASIDSGSPTSDIVSVNVLSAASQTVFYVDPTYTGGSNDGSSLHPWTTAHASLPGSAVWNAINSALASNNVVVYFSARQTDADVSEADSQSIELWRTDSSSHRLTLDGMSKYNTNDTIGSWTDYTGARKFKLAITTGSVGMGVQGNNYAYPANNTTIRGFEVTSNGGSARVLPTGNYSTLEYMWVHDITNVGATVQFAVPMSDYPACTVKFGNEHDITLRGNLIENGIGEGIYIPGTYFKSTQGGCTSWGQTHYDILIEGNTVRNPGKNGGEGDNIDLKSGLINVTVRGNNLAGGPSLTRGIVASGIFPNPDGTYSDRSNYLIENNYVHDRLGRCIDLQNQNYAIVRNNICANNFVVGINLSSPSSEPWPYAKSNHIWISNNTISNNAGSLGIGDAMNVVIRNNLIANLSSGVQLVKTYSAPMQDSDYNVLITGRSIDGGWVEGSHSRYFSNGTAFFMDYLNGDYRLVQGSAAIDIGANLSNTGFAVDFISTTRPQGSAWDIGAYEYASGTPTPVPPPPPPTPLQGDINQDHIVNSLDWSLMNSKWFTSDSSSDLNKDGLVNSLDYSILNSNWFKTW